MGELIRFPEPADRDDGGLTDITDTPEGQAVIRDLAKPVFARAIGAASLGLPEGSPVFAIDLDQGNWQVRTMPDTAPTAPEDLDS